MSYLINSLMISALIPAFSNSGATCFKYTSRAWPFLLLGLITTFNLRGLPEMPEKIKKVKIIQNELETVSESTDLPVITHQNISLLKHVTINNLCAL